MRACAYPLSGLHRAGTNPGEVCPYPAWCSPKRSHRCLFTIRDKRGKKKHNANRLPVKADNVPILDPSCIRNEEPQIGEIHLNLFLGQTKKESRPIHGGLGITATTDAG